MSEPTPATAIDPTEAALLFGGLVRPLLIAVSGGSDSIALMNLIAQWRAGGGGAAQPAPLVVTVDHGLRSTSADEARWVASEAAKLGLLHETLRWTGAKPQSGIQDAARAARYDLLLGLATRDIDAPRDIVLAHTLDDQAETLLMRLARGSGIDGLAAMRAHVVRTVVQPGHPVVEVPVTLRRPLLSIPKSRLVATLKAMDVAWLEDPSNGDTRFERVRIRQSQATLAALGLEGAALGRTARRLGLERQMLLGQTRRLAADVLNGHAGGYGELRTSIDAMPDEPHLVRLISRLLAVFGGEAAPARLSQIEALCQRLMVVSGPPFERMTLGGCLIEVERGQQLVVRAFRETGRTPLPTHGLKPGQGVYWDQRFYVSVSPHYEYEVEVRPLGQDGIALLAQKSAVSVTSHLPRAALLGLPSVWAKNALIAVGAMPAASQLVAPSVVECRWAEQQWNALFWRSDDG